MPGIIKRTVFMEVTKKNGDTFHRFGDFAAVTTGIGPMVEPYLVGQRIHPEDNQNFNVTDWEDDMMRIDDIEIVQSCDLKQVLSDDGSLPLHGGYTLPRTGR